MIKKEKRGIEKLVHNIKCLMIKDYEVKLESSRNTRKMILESTRGSINHFYNMDGVQIRGYYKRSTRFNNVLPTHPLLVRYK